jgi:hypothetical protein
MTIPEERENRVRLVDQIDLLPLEILDQLDRQDAGRDEAADQPVS